MGAVSREHVSRRLATGARISAPSLGTPEQVIAYYAGGGGVDLRRNSARTRRRHWRNDLLVGWIIDVPAQLLDRCCWRRPKAPRHRRGSAPSRATTGRLVSLDREIIENWNPPQGAWAPFRATIRRNHHLAVGAGVSVNRTALQRRLPRGIRLPRQRWTGSVIPLPRATGLEEANDYVGKGSRVDPSGHSGGRPTPARRTST
jgi:hypothetical protein